MVAITRAMAKGSKTNININMSQLATVLSGLPVISLIYFITPSSPFNSSVDSRFKISNSSLVILSFKTSICFEIVSLDWIESSNWVSNVLRAALEVVEIISPVSLSLYSILVPEESCFRSSEISSVKVSFSVCFSCLVVKNLFFLVSTFSIRL